MMDGFSKYFCTWQVGQRVDAASAEGAQPLMRRPEVLGSRLRDRTADALAFAHDVADGLAEVAGPGGCPRLACG
jgi:hypothetical protein